MSLTLETLSSVLSQQYSELPWDNYVLIKNFQFEVDNEAIIVSVAMERIKNHFPKTEIVFSGRVFTHTAAIAITPPNTQLWRAVINYFQSQVVSSPWVGAQNGPMFDTVKVNGQYI
jgi:hypothetical protein